MLNHVLPQIEVKKDILETPRYKPIFSVEAVNELVLKGIPFRSAYHQIAEKISSGTFEKGKPVNHSHEGSSGNLCNDKIRARWDVIFASFPFAVVNSAVKKLITPEVKAE